MTIRARLHASGAITVHSKPNWLARLFGARPRDYECEWAGGIWVDSHGHYVGWQATKAIEAVVGFEGMVGR